MNGWQSAPTTKRKWAMKRPPLLTLLSDPGISEVMVLTVALFA